MFGGWMLPRFYETLNGKPNQSVGGMVNHLFVRVDGGSSSSTVGRSVGPG